MEEKREYKKIVCGLPIMNVNEALIHREGKLQWNYYWSERVLDYQGYFTIVLEDILDEKIGADNWAINFVPEPVDEPYFTAKIYVNDKEHYHTVLAVIKEEITKDIRLNFYYGGDVATYIQPKG